ncbi:MAG: hypothetical protein HQL09_05475 [Nitrospirae bacterium]|nr:hypothetical protein [Nitrospirota bacterium]
MKDKAYTGIICKKFCSFYKEGKEDLYCGTYSFLKNNLTLRELRSVLELSEKPDCPSKSAPNTDEEIRSLVCEKCDFLIDGCDFREDSSHPPCGGYHIIEMLLS